MNKPTTIDEYIAASSPEVKKILQKVRQTIHAAVPDATEAISYGMPAFKLHGKTLVYFAGWQEHIGFYATPSGNQAFRDELAPYQGAKGSVRFPLGQPMPYDLITQIARFRAKELKKAS